ncbi:hypothetical protein OV203_36810 [Nannocystis sp. ILAH1]|uniref:hypothetical protein n=1 Tax=Nannocystis sp. ILAH1 TaxID=2996789 RepID=UPI00227102D0|nr:hypothetical protein [Nannocystis sp. ILAH1]MCY0992760.1 hypothetical protein [Nannocystis sp. ILAH1]
MPRPLTALFFVSLLACNSGASAPAPQTATGPAPSDTKVSPAAAACPEKVTAMRTLFAHGPGDATILDLPPGMELPTTSGGAPVGNGLPVFILADGKFKLDATMYATAADLQQALASELDKAKQLSVNTGVPAGMSLSLVIDARVPASTILALADGLPPEVTFFQIVQLAGDTAPPAPPAPPAVQKIFDESPADRRAVELAKALEKAIGGCKPVTELFQKLAVMDPASRGKTLLDGLPGAVEGCKCEGIDLDVLVPAVWQMTGKTSPAKRQFPLALSRDAKAEQQRLPANATAADLARLVEARGKTPFRLELEK